MNDMDKENEEEVSDEELARRMRHDAINKKFQETLLKALKKSGMVVDKTDKQEKKDANETSPEISSSEDKTGEKSSINSNSSGTYINPDKKLDYEYKNEEDSNPFSTNIDTGENERAETDSHSKMSPLATSLMAHMSKLEGEDGPQPLSV